MRNRIGSVLAALSLILGVGLTTVRGQAPSQGIEQQIRSRYLLTRVGTNGTVVGQAGSILVIQGDGLTAIPASYGVYWYSKFKNGGRVTSSGIQHGGSVAASERRFFQVGEKAYLINMEINPTEIVFYVQSCGACEVSTASAPDPNNVPYRARLAIEFNKGFLITGDLKQIQDTIGQVFGIETGQSIERTLTRDPASAGISLAPTRPFRFPSTYVSVQTPADQLQLNADNSFSLQEAGQTYHGTFLASGNTVEISIPDTNTKTTMTINGSNLTDPSGQTWTLREQSVPSAPSGDDLGNADIIKMTAVGLDDAIILAKIRSSKCKFDISTDALIELKRSGVSAPVLKAMVGAVTVISPLKTPAAKSNAPASPLPSRVPTPLTPADGSVFDTFPRKTIVSWTAVEGATEYRVEVDFSFSGVWASENAGHPTPPRTFSSKTTSLSFNFVGAQPGRWRVSALDRGGTWSEPSPWWGFRYLK
jgi:hypothetical protein